MEMEGSPVQVTWEKFQQEKPIIPVCNLGQLSRSKNRCRSSHLAGCREDSCKALSVIYATWTCITTCHEWTAVKLICQFRWGRRSPVTFSKQEMRFVCTRMCSACGFGQCLLGFGTSSVLGNKWGVSAAPGLANYLQRVWWWLRCLQDGSLDLLCFFHDGFLCTVYCALKFPWRARFPVKSQGGRPAGLGSAAGISPHEELLYVDEEHSRTLRVDYFLIPRQPWVWVFSCYLYK